MNFYEAQEFFNKMYSGKQISFEFDEKCHRQIEMICTDGSPNIMHHIECNKVKVNIEGTDPIYVPIAPHRYNITWANFKELVNKKTDVFILDQDLIGLKEKESYDSVMDMLMQYTGLSKEQILKKIN